MTGPAHTAGGGPSSVIWHDVECGAYAADLELWEELAIEAGGPVLDLGCGTGRVALHLARRGHQVIGIDSDADLIAALAERSLELPVDARLADAREFDVEGEFGLTLVPMQLMQLLGGSSERIDCLRRIAAHLRPDGRAAIAIVEEMPEPEAVGFPMPDAREIDGWVYSSLPIDANVDAGAIAVRRLRQTVSPNGELRDEVDEVRLRLLSAETLEREAAEAGLEPVARREIAPTDAHVGSTVVVLAREA
jgi:SAM-dependent methyltransferase